MKRFIASILIAATIIPAAPASANDGTAAIIGGIIGYTMGRNSVPYGGYPPPVYYPPPVPQAPPYAGNLPPAPYGFAYTPQYLPHCNCYQWILIPMR